MTTSEPTAVELAVPTRALRNQELAKVGAALGAVFTAGALSAADVGLLRNTDAETLRNAVFSAIDRRLAAA